MLPQQLWQCDLLRELKAARRLPMPGAVSHAGGQAVDQRVLSLNGF
jgi:hypothetical protein